MNRRQKKGQEKEKKVGLKKGSFKLKKTEVWGFFFTKRKPLNSKEGAIKGDKNF